MDDADQTDAKPRPKSGGWRSGLSHVRSMVGTRRSGGSETESAEGPAPPVGEAPRPKPGPRAEPEPDAEPPAEALEPAQDDGVPVEPEPEVEPETERRHRPRPSLAAPIIWERTGTATEPRPGDALFPRSNDDDSAVAQRSTDDEDGDSNEQRRRNRTSAVLRRLRGVVVIIAIVAIVAVLIRAFVVAPYYVPSASMEPTLHGCSGCDNDHVLVEKFSYRFHDVQPGDIVVFDRPSLWHVPDDVLIKRVIGVSGDTLVIKNGRVYRNRQQLNEPYLNHKCKPATTTRPGASKIASKAFARIPRGQVFVMGDNRCNSEDSRIFGTVPTSNLVGRAFLVVWPSSRLHSL